MVFMCAVIVTVIALEAWSITRELVKLHENNAGTKKEYQR